MDQYYARKEYVDRAIASIIFGYTIGVLVESLVPMGQAVSICIGGGATVVVLFHRYFGKWALHISIFLFSVVIGIGYFDYVRPDPSYLEDMVGEKVSVESVIREPIVKESSQQITVEQNGINIVVSVDKYEELSYGDEVKVTGVLEKPENFETDQGTTFDYISYLYKDDILYRMSYADVEVLSHDNGNWILARLVEGKNALLRSFHQTVPGLEGDLLSGIILGTKQSITNDFRSDLVTTGTIHIVALSGYNVSIIARGLQSLLLKIPKIGIRGAALGGGVSIILFVLMTGMQSSAVRAGIMALIALIARTKGKTMQAFHALVIAGFVMILWNPKLLVFDVSFQLSFLATLGLIFLTPILQKKLTWIPEKIILGIPFRELFTTTLGAQIAVLPILLYKTGVLSTISLPANILILPAIPLSMLTGSITGFLGLVSLTLAYPFAKITSLILGYTIWLIEFCAAIPFAAVTIKSFSLVLCLVSYGLVLVLVYRYRKIYSKKNT